MPATTPLPSRLSAELSSIVGPENLLGHRDERLVYECDGFVIEKNVPDVVVFPTSTEQVVERREGLQPAWASRSSRGARARAWRAGRSPSAAG